MKFYDDLNRKGKATLFVDMDGVLAEYCYNEKELIKSNAKDIFFNKRPLFSIINKIEDLYKQKKVDLYILSICYFEDQQVQKNKWLDKYLPFIKKEKRIIIIKKDKDSSGSLKGNYIKEKLASYDNIYLIDDDHRVLKEVKLILPNITTVHVSMLIN